MKINTFMPPTLRPHYLNELAASKAASENGQLQQAWRCLERAHVLGQPYPVQHSEVHWLMLKFGFKIKDGKEILGQIPRLLVGGVKSFVGVIPVGNTGGANVPPLMPLEIPTDLQQIIDNNKS